MPDAATEARFLQNVRAAANADKVEIRKGDSALALAGFLVDGREFDFIFVDGSHAATDVLVDVALAWRLLRVGGLMLLDDYGRGAPEPLLPDVAADDATGPATCARRVREAGALSMGEAIDAVRPASPASTPIEMCDSGSEQRPRRRRGAVVRLPAHGPEAARGRPAAAPLPGRPGAASDVSVACDSKSYSGSNVHETSLPTKTGRRGR